MSARPYMCADCNTAHNNFATTKSHHVRSVDEIRDELISEIKDTVTEVESQQKIIHSKLQQEENFVKELESCVEKTVDKIETQRTEMINKINKLQNEAIAKFKVKMNEITDTAMKRKQVLEKFQAETQTKHQILQELKENNDTKTIVYHSKDINNNIKMKITELSEELKCINTVALPTVDITPPQAPEYGSQVKVGFGKSDTITGTNSGVKTKSELSKTEVKANPNQIIASRDNMATSKLGSGDIKTQTVDTKVKTGLSLQTGNNTVGNRNRPDIDVGNIKYKCIEEVRLDYSPFRLHLYNDELWCTGHDNRLHVYDLECTHVGTVQLQGLSGVCAVIQDSHGQIIVACDGDKGLHECAPDGRHMTEIQSGSYSDVTEHQSVLYAWEYEQTCVYVFVHGEKRQWSSKDNKWIKSKSIKCGISYVSPLDRLSVLGDNMYISSYVKDCIYRVAMTGRVLTTYGHRGRGGAGELYGPRLCNVNKRGQLLVCDEGNDRIQVCDESGVWRVVNTEGGEMREPHDAVVSEDGRCMWVCAGNQKLLKYIIV